MIQTFAIGIVKTVIKQTAIGIKNVNIAAMKTSEKGINLIKYYEACRLKAYQCPSKIWTIGWGHTGNIQPTDIWTQQKADDTLKNDLISRELVVNKLNEILIGKKQPLNQNQFDALVSLVYNIGATRFKTSPLFAEILLNPKSEKIKSLFLKYVHNSSGQILPGLVARRNKEIQLYFQ